MKKSKSKPSSSRVRAGRDKRWRQYELMKASLPADLAPHEYQAACQRIAPELGI